MTEVSLGKVRFDKSVEGLARYFQTDTPENSGNITASFDPISPMTFSLEVDAREPLRTIGWIKVTGAIVLSSDATELVSRIQDNECMERLVTGLMNRTDPWPERTDEEKTLMRTNEDITISDID